MKLVLRQTINASTSVLGWGESYNPARSFEEVFGLVIGVVSISQDFGNLLDVGLSLVCAHLTSISWFRICRLRTKKYALEMFKAYEKGEWGL